jgi:hypothetical protein
MASAVATPLERQFGRIAGVTEMTSSSGLGSTNVTLQFELSRVWTPPLVTSRPPSTPRAGSFRQFAEQPELPEGQPG